MHLPPPPLMMMMMMMMMTITIYFIDVSRPLHKLILTHTTYSVSQKTVTVPNYNE